MRYVCEGKPRELANYILDVTPGFLLEQLVGGGVLYSDREGARHFILAFFKVDL